MESNFWNVSLEKVQDSARNFGKQFGKPIIDFLGNNGISPNFLTIVGLIFVIPIAVIIYAGGFFIASVLLLLFSTLDFFDGEIARQTDNVTKFGGILDSVLDRYQDGLIFGAITLHFAVDGNLFIAIMSLLTLMGAFAVSYTKARAENEIDEKCNLGIANRFIRMLIVIFMLMFNLVGLGIIILFIIIHLTVLQRMFWSKSKLNNEIKEE